MKYLKYLFLMIIVSCNSTNEPNVNEVNLNITGHINEKTENGISPSQNTGVTIINSDIENNISTDEKGDFIFQTEYKNDTTQIIINKSNFTSIDTIIITNPPSANDNVNLEVEFTLAKIESYFPFVIGKTWNYEVKSWSYASLKIGRENWELIDIANDTSNVSFKINYYYDKEVIGEIFPDTIYHNISGEDTMKIYIAEDGSWSCKENIGDFPMLDNFINSVNNQNGYACTNDFNKYFSIYHPINENNYIHIQRSDGCGGSLEYEMVRGDGFKYLYINFFNTMAYVGNQYILK